jgi:hypothetical protein
MEQITTGKVVPKYGNKPITLPKDFQKHLRKGKYSNLLMILEKPLNRIVTRPVNHNEVLRIGMDIGQLSPDFLIDLGVVFMRNKIKTEYSTGLMFTSDFCGWEGYVNASDLTIPQQQLKDELEEIRGVSEVEFKNLYAEQPNLLKKILSYIPSLK